LVERDSIHGATSLLSKETTQHDTETSLKSLTFDLHQHPFVVV